MLSAGVISAARRRVPPSFLILLSGDEQSGTDHVLLSGDAQSGSDRIELSVSPGGDGVQTFDYLSQVGTFTGVAQGVATDGTNFYFTAGEVGGSDVQQWTLYKADASLSVTDSRDTGSDGSGTHTQLTSIYYDPGTDKLFVCANNFFSGQSSGRQGWVYEYNASDLSFVTYHDTGTNICEAVWFHDGSWWQVNHTNHEIRQFDTSWNLVAAHSLPDADPGTAHWQAIFVINDIFYLNLHAESLGGTIGTRLRAYTFDGSDFSRVSATITPPTYWCTQGAYYDGTYVYWAERIGFGSDLNGSVIKSILRKGKP